MGKVNIQQALNQVLEESSNFPLYWGMKCNRGLWLTRYPIEWMPTDPRFMASYIGGGGGLDSCGHWGRHPSDIKKKESEGWSYYEIFLLGAGVPEKYCLVEGVDQFNWKTYAKGIKRANALDSLGIEFGCSVWTLANKTQKTFLKILFSKGFRVTAASSSQYDPKAIWINHLVNYRKSFSVGETRRKNPYDVREALIIEGKVHYNVEEILPKKFFKYIKKSIVGIRSNSSSNERVMPFVSKKSTEIFLKHAKTSRYDSYLSIKGRSYHGSNTSVGMLFHIQQNQLFLVDKEDNNFKVEKTFSIRKVAGYNVCKVSNTWFVWKENFYNHIEGTGDLKSVLDRAERREKKNSLVLALNDVRNDVSGTAGFCITGTKSFLYDRMRHVYNLIKDYNSWSSVPEDIMSLEWHLADRRIFDGYQSPLYN